MAGGDPALDVSERGYKSQTYETQRVKNEGSYECRSQLDARTGGGRFCARRSDILLGWRPE